MSRTNPIRQVRATLIIPAYNEGERLPPFLEKLCVKFASHPKVEIIIVDDGSERWHFNRVERWITSLGKRYSTKITLMKCNHQGKGGALEAGFLAAETPIVGFADADGSVGPDECMRLILELANPNARAVSAGYDAVFASRIRLLGNTVDKKITRHLIGRVFANILQWMFSIPVYDSQCGAKFFVRERILPLLGHVQSKTWLWDTQLLLLMHRAGMRMREIPVNWDEKAGSKISIFRDSMRMFWGLIRFKRHLKRLGAIAPPAADVVPLPKRRK